MLCDWSISLPFIAGHKTLLWRPVIQSLAKSGSSPKTAFLAWIFYLPDYVEGEIAVKFVLYGTIAIRVSAPIFNSGSNLTEEVTVLYTVHWSTARELLSGSHWRTCNGHTVDFETRLHPKRQAFSFPETYSNVIHGQAAHPVDLRTTKHIINAINYVSIFQYHIYIWWDMKTI